MKTFKENQNVFYILFHFVIKMINIDQIMKDILASFKYEPEFDEYEPTHAKTPYLKEYNEFEFLTKCLKLKLIRDDGVEIKNEYYLSDYDQFEELKKYDTNFEFYKFNGLVHLYNECWRYKEMLEDNKKRKNEAW